MIALKRIDIKFGVKRLVVVVILTNDTHLTYSLVSGICIFNVEICDLIYSTLFGRN